MGRLGFTEILFIALVIMLLFGSQKLPEIGSAIGKAIKEFRKAVKDVDDDVKGTKKDDLSEKKS